MPRKLALIVLPMLFTAVAATAQNHLFRVVVHADNPVKEASAKEVSKMFLKISLRWEHGARVMAVDRAMDTELFEDFSLAVHDRSADAIAGYWNRQVFSGGKVPPERLASDAAVFESIRDSPGAIGYVSARAPLPRHVRTLKITDVSAGSRAERIVSERGSARLLLTGNCGEDGSEAILINRDEYAASSVTVETSTWIDDRFKSKSVRSHTLGGGEEKRLGCTRQSANVELRYDLVKAASNARPRPAVFERPRSARDFISILRTGTCGRGGAGEHVIVVNKSGQREISALIEHVTRIDGKMKNRSMRSYRLRPGGEKKLGCSLDGSVAHEYALLQTN